MDGFFSLPFDLRLHLFSRLDIPNLFKLTQLSKTYTQRVLDDVWIYFLQRDIHLLEHKLHFPAFVSCVQHALSHLSWSHLYKELVVLPGLEKELFETIEFSLFWKMHASGNILNNSQSHKKNLLEVMLHLFDAGCSEELEETIMLTHRTFLTFRQFILLIRIIYCVPKFDPVAEIEKAYIETTRVRILEVFSRWVQLFADDVHTDLQAIRLVNDFAKYTVTPDHAVRFSPTILMRMRDTKPTNIPYFDKSPQHSFLNILNADLNVLAMDLAQLDWELYSRCRVHEFVHRAWRNRDLGPIQAPNILASIRWFNHISGWVATELLSVQDLSQRAKVLSTFIKLAGRCRKLNDFQTLFAILSGLSISSVFRLKQTWQQLSHKVTNKFNILCSLISTPSMYKNYRIALQTAKLPIIPYLGVFLADITFLLDTSHVIELPQVHIRKCEVMASVLREVVKYQQVPMPYCKSKYCEMLMGAVVMEEGVLYELSLKAEPRTER